jgi:hypothetical protein
MTVIAYAPDCQRRFARFLSGSMALRKAERRNASKWPDGACTEHEELGGEACADRVVPGSILREIYGVTGRARPSGAVAEP